MGTFQPTPIEPMHCLHANRVFVTAGHLPANRFGFVIGQGVTGLPGLLPGEVVMGSGEANTDSSAQLLLLLPVRA